MVRWHHWLNEHEFEQTLGDSGGRRSLTCCSPWGHKESTQLSNWTKKYLEDRITALCESFDVRRESGDGCGWHLPRLNTEINQFYFREIFSQTKWAEGQNFRVVTDATMLTSWTPRNYPEKTFFFSLASIQNIYSMQKCILKCTDFKGKKTCCLTSELTCLIEGKEVNWERKKKNTDVKEEYKNHEAFYNKWMNVGTPPSDQRWFMVYLWLQPGRYQDPKLMYQLLKAWREEMTRFPWRHWVWLYWRSHESGFK